MTYKNAHKEGLTSAITELKNLRQIYRDFDACTIVPGMYAQAIDALTLAIDSLEKRV
tara:strand:+ start:4212 stop:4382 length:171 start_codon:yes stop_codon:yes gene_type:complete